MLYYKILVQVPNITRDYQNVSQRCWPGVSLWLAEYGRIFGTFIQDLAVDTMSLLENLYCSPCETMVKKILLK